MIINNTVTYITKEKINRLVLCHDSWAICTPDHKRRRVPCHDDWRRETAVCEQITWSRAAAVDQCELERLWMEFDSTSIYTTQKLMYNQFCYPHFDWIAPAHKSVIEIDRNRNCWNLDHVQVLIRSGNNRRGAASSSLKNLQKSGGWILGRNAWIQPKWCLFGFASCP